MAQLRRSLSLGLLLAAAFLKPGFAANSAAPKAGATAPVQVSAVWIKGQAAPPERELFVAVGDAPPVPLAVGGGGRGRATDIKSGATLRLLARAATPPSAKSGASASATQSPPVAPPQPAFVPIGEVNWPTGASRKVLLILAASKDSGGTVHAIAMNDDEAAFPVHTVRVANFTTASLLMRFGQTVKPLPPGILEPIPYGVSVDPKAKDTPDVPFAVAAGEQVFFNGFIDPKPQSRTLVLVIPPSGGGKMPVVQTVRERLASPAGAAPSNRPPPRS